MKRLPLNSLHRSSGADLYEALGVELPAKFSDVVAEVSFVRESAGLFDQSYRGVLDLRGERVREVLQGVLSSSVVALPVGHGQSSCLLSAKGRLAGAFDLYAIDEHMFRVVTREPMRESLVKNITKYVFLGDVEVDDVSEDVCLLSVQGPAARDVVEACDGSATVLNDGESVAAEIEIGSVPCRVVCGGETPEGGYEVWVASQSAEPVWRALCAEARAAGGGVCGHAASEVLRVEAGHARFGQDYDEESFPNEIGWEYALTYDKCYVGQEVVARMRTYGEVNRKLRGILPNVPDQEVNPGDRVFDGDDEAGVVTSVVYSERLQRRLCLASMKRRFWQATELVVKSSATDVEARQVDLPFVRLDATGSSG